MTISDATKRVFYEQGENKGWDALFAEQLQRERDHLESVKPENTLDIHRTQQFIRFYKDEIPRVRSLIEEYAAQRAATAQSAAPK